MSVSVNQADLQFILAQIKIAEAHSATRTPDNPCGTLVARPGDGIPDVDQVPDVLTSFGLRTVDGSCNNLKTGNEKWAASDQVFPRLTNPKFRDLTPVPTFPVPSQTSYSQAGDTVDEQPRVISNLIVDQTSENPAAVSLRRFAIVAWCCASPRPVRKKTAYPSALAWLTRSSMPGVAGNMLPVKAVGGAGHALGPVRPTKFAFVHGSKIQLLNNS